MRLYYVNPLNTADVVGPYLVGMQNVTLPDGRTLSRIVGPAPEFGLYEAIEDNTPVPPYQSLDRIDLAFEGVVGQATARVRETRVFAQIPIDDLLEVRLDELSDKTRQVYDQGISATIDIGAVVVVSTEGALVQYLGIHNSTLPAGTDVTLVDHYGRFYVTKVNQMDTIITAIVTFLRVGANANAQTHRNALTAAHGAGDWSALATYDISTGWQPPPPPTP